MHPGRFRFTIQLRVVLLTLVFTAVIAAVVLVTSMSSSSRRIHQSSLQAVEYQLKTASDSVRQRVEEVDSLYYWSDVTDIVRTFMLSNARSRALRNEVYNMAFSRCGSSSLVPYLQRYVLAGSNGSLLMLGSAASVSRIISLDNIELLPGLAPGSPGTAWEQLSVDPLTQPGSAMTGIPISRRIDGDNTGYIYISVSPRMITDVLNEYTLEAGSALYWIMGSSVYRLENGQLVAVDLDLGALRPRDDSPGLLSADTRLYDLDVDGVPYCLVVCPLGSHGLYLAETVAIRSPWSQLPQLVQPILFIFLTILVLGFLLTTQLHRVIATPIRALQRQIEQVGQGRFTTDPTIEWDHELGDVGRGINQLSQSVTALMERRVEDEKQRQALEFRMLQSQINPHFLYNTLNSIRWMAAMQHAGGIVEMVTALSRLLKSVSKSTRQMIPLRQELSLLNDYFTIQRYRYGGTISMEVLCLAQERCLDVYEIPRFTLQPLAENAIFHGIEPTGSAGNVKLTIRMADTDDDLLVELADNGVGMTQEQMDAILREDPQEETGSFRRVGVLNVHKRLCYSFGPQYGLEFHSAPGMGTTVSFRLAKREKEDSV